MNIIFFGTSEFAVLALKALIRSRHRVCLVVTQPKRRKGRGLKLLPTEAESFAEREGIETFACKDVNSRQSLKLLSQKKADVFVAVDFGQIFSNTLLNLPKLCCLNIHASLLPKYRGAAPIQRALLNGEEETGVTVIKITEKLDSGDIIEQARMPIKYEDNSITLRKRLSGAGAELLIKALDKIESSCAKFIRQDESRATYAARIKKEDGLIKWQSHAAAIVNQMRACKPWPSAYTYINGKQLKILEARIVDKAADAKPGSIVKVDKDSIIVACKDSCLLVTKLQLEGKKPLDTPQFLRGYPLPEKQLLG